MKTVIKAFWLQGHGYNMGLIVREIHKRPGVIEIKSWIGTTIHLKPLQPIPTPKEDAEYIMKTGAKFPALALDSFMEDNEIVFDIID